MAQLLSDGFVEPQNKAAFRRNGLPLLASLRAVLGQVRSTFDVRFAMDHGRIVIANLGKGFIGEDYLAHCWRPSFNWR